MTAPKVTVLMSVLNGEDYLRPAIDSVLEQTFTDFEFLIIDNASTDGTANIIASYEDDRIRCVRNDDVLTLTESLNKGLKLARGDYIARLDADDIAMPERFAKQAAFLDSHPEVALVASAATDFGNGVPFPGKLGLVPAADHETLMAELAQASIVSHSSIMFRRREVRNIGDYPADYTYCMDYLLYFRLARQCRLAALSEPLVAIRSHAAQITALPSWRLRREQEAVAAFNEVLAYPELPVPVRRGLQKYKTATLLRMAVLHAQSLAPLSAAKSLFWAIAEAPLQFIRILGAAATRRLTGS